MLLQRPINMRTMALSNILSREETAYMREMALNRFESIMQVLKSMPRAMLLVFRNINTVRSINVALGAPVDRYFVMAKRLELALKSDCGMTCCSAFIQHCLSFTFMDPTPPPLFM